ncbi:MAG: glucokinase [Casimicrobiaceae bacterium]|nr:glucokinase [Casimicrobiaceae bacterium]
MNQTSAKQPRIAMNAEARLVGDIGGTRARLAWQDARGAALRAISTYRLCDFRTPLALLRHYLAEHGLPAPAAICLGVASALEGDEVQLTNAQWRFSLRALGRALGVDRIWAINDFAALANAVPLLDERQRKLMGGSTPDLTRPIVVLGPGTGLGLASLVPTGAGSWIVVPGQGGHVTLPATSDRQWALIACLQRRFGHVSAERVLSGAGLLNTAQALALIDGRPAPEYAEPSEVTEGARQGDPICTEAVALFAFFLGVVAGNAALTLGARGGVYVGGGVVHRLGSLFDWGRFREGFEAKGRLSPWLVAIPTYWILDELAALQGAARALDGLLSTAEA